MRAKTYQDLRDMSVEDLIGEHDHLVSGESGGVEVGINYCLNELHRREQDKLSRSVKNYTVAVWWATAVILVATLVNVGIEIHRFLARSVILDRGAAHSLLPEDADSGLGQPIKPGAPRPRRLYMDSGPKTVPSSSQPSPRPKAPMNPSRSSVRAGESGFGQWSGEGDLACPMPAKGDPRPTTGLPASADQSMPQQR